jgi:hypothetical protein
MNQSTLFKFARRFMYAVGCGYALIWSVVIWFIVDGSLITQNTACAPVVWPPVAYWTCHEGFVAIFAVTFLNVALSATVWSPVIVAMAVYNLAFAPTAMLVVALNAIGASGIVTIVWKLMWGGYSILRRELVEEFG